MRTRLGLLIASLAVLSAGRFLVGELRGFADREARAELDADLTRSLERWDARLPRAAVLRFEAAAASPTAGPRLAQLRFELVPRRVVRVGEADFTVVEGTHSELAGRADLVPIDELDEGLWLCRTRS